MIETDYTRHVEPRLKEALADSPVVLIQGARQCGKTTLAQMVGRTAGYEYISFDDDDVRKSVEEDPVGFANNLSERVILDEAQRVPWLFSSIKLMVDRNRTPGRFLLTGSVNVLQVRQIADSLAGRMEIIDLHPFSQCELAQTAPTFLDSLFATTFQARRGRPAREQIADRVVAGGYPAALQRSGRRRTAWYNGYIRALVQHDVPDVAAIRSPENLSRLLLMAAAQTARLLSVNGLATSFALSRTAVRDYLFLLEKMFLLEKLPAWHSNRLQSLIKTPKLHVSDTGIACALMKLNGAALAYNGPLFGHMLESFVLQELRRQASGHQEPHTFYHYRDKGGAEVDIVIERDAMALTGVEVKASATLKKSDFRGLRKLRDATGERFAGGVLVYNGERPLPFGDRLYAVPLQMLWGATA